MLQFEEQGAPGAVVPMGGASAEVKAAPVNADAEEVYRRVAAIEQAGVDHLAGLVFPGRTLEEVLEQMEEFSQTVIKQFPEPS